MDQPELPDLKKKEKERKKAGAVFNGWGGGSGGTGLAGAAGGAARGAAVEALEAAQIGASRGFFAQLLARLFATTGGRLALAGLAALLVGMLLIGPRLGSSGHAGPGTVALGGISDTLQVHRPDSSPALDSLSQVARGTLKFDPDPPAPKPVEKAPEAPAAEKQPEKTDWNNVLESERPATTDRLAHNLSGAKLSESLGGAFGGKNIFTDPNAPKFGSTLGAKLGGLNGRSTAMNGNTRSKVAARSSAMRSRSPRAIGQLKFARALSSKAGLSASEEGARTSAADAFDGRVTNGGASPMIGKGDGTGTVNPLGNGTVSPPDAQHFNQTPYQGNLDAAKQQAADAGNMKMMGMIMLAIGAMLLMAGIMMMQSPTPSTQQMGMMLMLAGVGLIAAGIMMLMMASNEKKQADQNADQVQQQQGQNAHAQDTKQCINEAYNNGGHVNDSCKGSIDTHVQEHSTTVQEAVNTELNSGYTVGDGGKPGKGATGGAEGHTLVIPH